MLVLLADIILTLAPLALEAPLALAPLALEKNLLLLPLLLVLVLAVLRVTVTKNQATRHPPPLRPYPSPSLSLRSYPQLPRYIFQKSMKK